MEQSISRPESYDAVGSAASVRAYLRCSYHRLSKPQGPAAPAYVRLR